MLVRFCHRNLIFPSTLRYFHCSGNLRYASKKVLHQFKLADIGEGITECEIIKWNVKPQEIIQAFDALCEVQSDKASVEITSPYDGKVIELLVQEGEIAKVGSGLCTIEISDEVSSAPEPEPAIEDRSQGAASPQPPESPIPRRLHPLDPSNHQSDVLRSDVDVLATPSVRHFAKKVGVNLALLAPGSGKGGRIERSDIELYLSGVSPSQSTPSVSVSNEDAVVELGRTRFGMWKAMEKSLEIPHFGYSTSIDLTNLSNLLPSINANIPLRYLPESHRLDPSSVYPAPQPPDVAPAAQYSKLTFLPFMLKTLAKAMMEWPLFRSSITIGSTQQSKPTLTIRPTVDLALALSTPTGLYIPTLQDVGKYNIFELMARVKEFGHKGRQIPCQLTPQDMPKRGGTVTISNVGAIGKGEYAHPVLVPGGGVAIVAIGRAEWVWDVSEARPHGERRLKVGVSWSADHRIVEGAELAAFVERWREWIEDPVRLIGEGR